MLATLPGERHELIMERFKGSCFRFRHLLFNVILGCGLLVLYHRPFFWANLPFVALQLISISLFATWLSLTGLNSFVSKLFLGGWLIVSSLMGYYLTDVIHIVVFDLSAWEQILLCILSPWILWTGVQQLEMHGDRRDTNNQWMFLLYYYGSMLMLLAIFLYWATLRRFRRMFS